VGPRNHVLDGGSVPTGGMGNFWGISSPIMKIGNMGVGAPLVSVGVASTGTVGASASIIFPGTTKIQKNFMMACNNIFGFNPVGAPTCLRKQEVGKNSLNAAQPNAKAEGCVHDDPPRADKLWKGWSFRVGTWNIYSLTGRSGN